MIKKPTPQEESERRMARGVYLLPNLFTTASLFAGFYAVVAAMKGLFDIASIAIFIAMIADLLDGRIARFTGTQTAFGAEYDSLSDLVAFGIAPALVAYSWGLFRLGKVGWLIAFMYVAATALRLARFNSSPKSKSKYYFYGIPCPPAAAVMASGMWLIQKYHLQGRFLIFLVAATAIALGALMVSNVRFNSFKKVDFKGRVPFIAISLLVLVFVGIAINPPLVLFVVFFSYALSGPVFAVIGRGRG
jgi:CDP-diacylglycerol---serine O-phosphatidyltransferase